MPRRRRVRSPSPDTPPPIRNRIRAVSPVADTVSLSSDSFIDDEDAYTDMLSSDATASNDSDTDLEALADDAVDEYTLVTEPDRDELVRINGDALNDSGNPETSESSPASIVLSDDQPGPSNFRMPPRRSTGQTRGRRRSHSIGRRLPRLLDEVEETTTTNHTEEGVPAKRMKTEVFTEFAYTDSPSTDDNVGCTICFDDYTADGEHRPVCLKCGHIFGRSCIDRWIRVEKNNKCPTCKSNAKAVDIRPLFISMGAFSGDNAQTNQLASKIKALEEEKEQKEKKIAEIEEALADALQHNEDLHTLYSVPKPDITFKCTLKMLKPTTVSQLAKLKSGRSFSVSPNGNFFVTSCDLTATVLNGIPMSNGIQRISLTGDQSIKMQAHSKQIRCIHICPFRDRLVASVSDDRTLIVRDLETGAIGQARFTHKLISDCWTFCWETESKIIVGLRNGLLQRICIDDRSIEELVDETGRGQISFVHYEQNHRVLFVASVKGVYVYRNSSIVDLVKERIQSFFYDPKSNTFLLTVPPSTDKPVRLQLYKVEFGAKITATLIRDFDTSIKSMMQLTMNIVWIAPTEHIVCAYYDESRKINRIFNWGKLDDAEPLEIKPKDERCIKLPNDTEPVMQYGYFTRQTQPSALAPNGVQNTLMVLTRAQLHTIVIV